LDAGSFAISVAALLAMSPAPASSGPTSGAPETQFVAREISAGFRYVRSHAWLWAATLVTAAIAYLLFMGPTDVLLPSSSRPSADGARDPGLIFAAGGLGSLACALAVSQLGLPRRSLTFMYAAWMLATLAAPPLEAPALGARV
jgi:hypothetical protein